jgi:hypothetical protein
MAGRHNFLHRTGILQRFKAKHQYGLACYRLGGCSDIIQIVAEHIDARQFNPTFPLQQHGLPGPAHV